MKKMEAINKLCLQCKRYIECPSCHIGLFGGIFYHSCNNKDCELYDSFAMGRCNICKSLRVYCTC